MAGLTFEQLQNMGAQPIGNGTHTPNSGVTFAQLQQMGASPVGDVPQPKSKGFLNSGVIQFLTGNTQRFGKTIGESIASPQNAELFNQSVSDHNNITNNLIKAINAKKAIGGDTSRLQDALNQHISETPKLEDFTGNVINKTNKQVIGEAIGTGLEAMSGGILKSGINALKTPGLAGKLIQGAKIGAPYGAIGGLSGGLQNNENTGQLIESTLSGGTIGAGLGAVGELAGNVVNKVAKPFVTPKEKFVTELRQKIASEYEKSLPLSPTQKIKENNLLSKTGDNVYTTLAKYDINLGSPEATSQLQQISELFRNATQKAQINEGKMFNLDAIKADAFRGIDERIPSETARNFAKNKIETEIDSLIKNNKNSIQKGQNNETLASSDLIERIRRIGNSWTPFNASDPERVGQSTGYALSNAVRDIVEKEGSFPAYRNANKEWGKILHAQEVLGKFDMSGKKFSVSGGLSGAISRRIVSGALGYHAGGLGGLILGELGTDYATEILSNPELKTWFDRKLINILGNKNPTPEAVAKLETEIRNFVQKRSELLKLPQGGESSAPIITPAPTTYEPQSQSLGKGYSNEIIPTATPTSTAIPSGGNAIVNSTPKDIIPNNLAITPSSNRNTGKSSIISTQVKNKLKK